jgi:hypothetical protein
MNQHYSHVAAMTIAMEIGADVILPYALKRDSFGKYFNPDPSKNRWGCCSHGCTAQCGAHLLSCQAA